MRCIAICLYDFVYFLQCLLYFIQTPFLRVYAIIVHMNNINIGQFHVRSEEHTNSHTSLNEMEYRKLHLHHAIEVTDGS